MHYYSQSAYHFKQLLEKIQRLKVGEETPAGGASHGKGSTHGRLFFSGA